MNANPNQPQAPHNGCALIVATCVLLASGGCVLFRKTPPVPPPPDQPPPAQCEAASNLPVHPSKTCTAIYPRFNWLARPAWMERGANWPVGKQLHVRWLSTPPDITPAQWIRMRDRIIDHAKTWEAYANVSFVFDNANPAEIRIGFGCTGHWSYVGRWQPSEPAQTMNLQFYPQISDEEMRRVVLHEFGHALGFQHEHQAPNGRIHWDERKVLGTYQWTQGWSEDEVREQVLNRSNSTNYITSGYDPDSIMMYPIPRELLLPGWEHEATGWNTVLSPRDKKLARTVYPKQPTP